jgi:hypothetical protein
MNEMQNNLAKTDYMHELLHQLYELEYKVEIVHSSDTQPEVVEQKEQHNDDLDSMKDAFSDRHLYDLLELGTDPIERQLLEKAQVCGKLDKRGVFALKIGQYFLNFKTKVWENIDHGHFIANKDLISKAGLFQRVLRALITRVIGEESYAIFNKEIWEREAQRKLRDFDNTAETMKSSKEKASKRRKLNPKDEEVVELDVFGELMYLRRKVSSVTQLPNVEFEPLRISETNVGVNILTALGPIVTNETIQEKRQCILEALEGMQAVAAGSWKVLSGEEIDPNTEMNTQRLLGLINSATDHLIGVRLKSNKKLITKKTTDERIKTKTANTLSGVTTRRKQNKLIPYEFDKVDVMFQLLGEMQATCRMTSPELAIIRELYKNSETVEPVFLHLFRFYKHVVTDLA